MRATLITAFLLLAGCTKEPLLDPRMPAPEERKPTANVNVVDVKVPAGAVGRPQVDAVLREGPGWLLDQVPVEEVMREGKFVGWRIRELPAQWSGGELRAGDVVTRINAMPVETPNDFWAAWTTLSVASELKIDYLRGDEARVFSLPIVGQPDPQMTASINERRAPPPNQGRDHRFDTITIEGEPIDSQPTVDYTGK